MVYVKLERSWTDPAGTTHDAGAMVDVDAGTLASLQANGTVTEPGGGDPRPDTSGWAGPDGGGSNA